MSVMYIWLGFKMDGPYMPNQEVSNVKRFSPQKMFIYHVTVCHWVIFYKILSIIHYVLAIFVQHLHHDVHARLPPNLGIPSYLGKKGKIRSTNLLLKPNIGLPLACMKIIWLRDLPSEFDLPQAQPYSLHSSCKQHQCNSYDCYSITEYF